MNLEAQSLFYDRIFPRFQEICKIRRPSGDEREMGSFITRYADQLKLQSDADSHGNIVVRRKASMGLENMPSLLFQGHLDMVCVPDKNIFPIKPIITDGWVHTEGTTLGADNGIAVAIMMELLNMKFTKNPPMEFLFTVSEEVGLLGAARAEPEKLKLQSSKLINLDSEEIDKITVGCAGGMDFNVNIAIEYEERAFDNTYSIAVKGPGGHSGLKIHENIPNTIKIAGEVVSRIHKENPVRITGLHGGFARNAIPAEAEIVINCEKEITNMINAVSNEIRSESSDLKPFQISVSKSNNPGNVFSRSCTDSILKVLKMLPHGVVKMNTESGGVLSSVNLAQISIKDTDLIIIMNSRSSNSTESDAIIESIKIICNDFPGTSLKRGDSYPGWRPNLNSELLVVTMESFNEVRGKNPDYLDIHAGLECGILMDKFPVIKEAVSIGPEIHNAHTIEEKLDISSTVEIFDIILKIIDKHSDSGNKRSPKI